MTKTVRDIIRQLELLESIRGSFGGPLVECISLLLKWRNSPDVILAATERIHEVTRERMEAQQ